MSKRFDKLNWSLRALTLLGIVSLTSGVGAGLHPAIEVSGSYRGVALDPISGKPRHQDMRSVEAAFRVLLIGDAWLIAATNLNEIVDPAIDFCISKHSVGQVWCNGTNTFTLQPDHRVRGDYLTNLATVAPTRFYTASYAPDFIGMSLPWLTYCLAPSAIPREKSGVVALPLPWAQARFSQLAYGYKWIIDATEDGRFVKDLSVVRDHSLDLSDSDSLLRPSFVYPDSLASYERNLLQLAVIRGIPDGWLQSSFRVTEWHQTNGISVPTRSEFTEYYFNPQIENLYPVYKAELRVSQIVFRLPDQVEFIPPVVKPTPVFDFRYRRVNNTRIHRMASYTLQPGEMWKPDNDPLLLQQAADYLKHGPRYDAFLKRSRVGIFLVWLAFRIITVVPILVML